MQRQTERAILSRGLGFVGTLGAFVAVADAITKAVAQSGLSREPLAVTPFLNLRLGFNPGVSFGLFPMHSASGVAMLILLQAATIAVLLAVAARKHALLEQVGFGLIIGGAVGNVIDRVRDGVVTDFLDLHIYGQHWPTFNLADVAITCGVAVLLWTVIRSQPAPARMPLD